MSAVTDAVRVTAPGDPIGRSIRDSLVVAGHDPIRMARIPHPVRSSRPGSPSSRMRDRRPDTLKGQAK
jgi:hypothetical protein